MKNSSFFLTLSIAALISIGAGCATTSPTDTTVPTTTSSTSGVPTGKLALDTATSPAGYSFSYPRFFTATLRPDNASFILSSEYSVTDNPSGVPGNETSFPLEMRVTYVSSTKKINLSNELAKAVPGWKTDYDNYKAGKGSGNMETILVGGNEAYRFQAGAEGMNVSDVFVPRNDYAYVMMHLSYIGDSLKNSIQPKAISEQEQLASFATLLGSFTFAN